jgi:fibronectin type 3 domain-containing protein
LPIAILAILLCGAGGLVLFRVLAYLGPHSILLKWNAPVPRPGVTVTSYSIFRGTQPGGPYDPLVSGVTSLSYTDTTVSNGKTYYYVVRAVDAAGNPSPYSEEASAAVP